MVRVADAAATIASVEGHPYGQAVVALGHELTSAHLFLCYLILAQFSRWDSAALRVEPTERGV